MEIKKENEIISIKHESVGSIKHFISLKNDRCTFYTNEYMRETCKPTLTTAATYEEVEQMRDVFNCILKLMKKETLNETRSTKVKHPSGKRGFLITLPDDTKISVLDFSDVMKSAPKIVRESGIYLGWEAWDGKETFRGKNFSEVESMLMKKYHIVY